MDIKLSEDQLEMVRQARRFCENELPMTRVREVFEGKQGFTEADWQKMVGLGWSALLIPEAYGGVGMELLDMALVLQEMGRTVAPGPLFSTVLLGATAIAEAGSEAQQQKYLSAVAEGKKKGTLALWEAESGSDPDYIEMAAKAEGDGYVLNGLKEGVPDAEAADFVVCAARTAEGITLFVIDLPCPGVTITTLPTMDATRKLSLVAFKDVRVPSSQVLGRPGEGGAPLQRALQKAQVGLCAENVGGAERAMEIAAEYAKVRVQFDQPIGSFQAIKHRCAQMYIDVESARSLLYWAAWAQDHGDADEAALAASTAKVYCSEAYRNVAASAVQVLGGTGFSWEHDIHFYLKRAKANEVAWGDLVYHREQVIRLVEK